MTSSSGNGAACPNDPVVFTCTVTGRTSLLWTVNLSLTHTIINGLRIVLSGIDGIRTLQPTGPEGFMFQAAITSTSSDSLTSTLTTLTEVSLLNGTNVNCTGDQTESLTIIVVGESKR